MRKRKILNFNSNGALQSHPTIKLTAHRQAAQRWKTMIRNTNEIGKEESEHVSYNKKIKFIIRIKEEKLRAPATIGVAVFVSWFTVGLFLVAVACPPNPSPVFLSLQAPTVCRPLHLILLLHCACLLPSCSVSPKSQTVRVHTLGILLQICCKINISLGSLWRGLSLGGGYGL